LDLDFGILEILENRREKIWKMFVGFERLFIDNILNI
jgi:hypothetical protein